MAVKIGNRSYPAQGGPEYEQLAGAGMAARGGTGPVVKVPTQTEFNDMVSQGRLWFGVKDPLNPNKKALDAAQTPVDYGRLYGYGENDIAHFYAQRRGGHPMAYQEYIRDMQSAGPRTTPEPPARKFNWGD
jgi:hypothetical protein